MDLEDLAQTLIKYQCRLLNERLKLRIDAFQPIINKNSKEVSYKTWKPQKLKGQKKTKNKKEKENHAGVLKKVINMFWKLGPAL